MLDNVYCDYTITQTIESYSHFKSGHIQLGILNVQVTNFQFGCKSEKKIASSHP